MVSSRDGGERRWFIGGGDFWINRGVGGLLARMSSTTAITIETCQRQIRRDAFVNDGNKGVRLEKYIPEGLEI
jgi:hypothetical protein